MVRGPRRAQLGDDAAGRARATRPSCCCRSSTGSSARSRPHLVTVIGQAGVGKSRLLRELDARDRRSPVAARRAARQLPRLRRRARLLGARRDRPRHLRDRRHRRCRSRLAQAAAAGSRTCSPTPRSRSRPSGSRRRSAGRSGSSRAGRRRRAPPSRGPAADARAPLLGGAARWSRPAAGASRCVFAVEDIHWADEGMLDLIEYLARWARGPMLIVCLARDELLDRRPGWGGGRLQRDDDHARPARPRARRSELVAALLRRRGDRDGATWRPQVAARSGGNPLFAEEMVNRIVEEGAGDAEALPGDGALGARGPARLAARGTSAASLQARLGRRPDLLGGLGRRTRRRRGASSARRSSRCGARTWSCRPPAAGSPASASTRSSTC